MTTNDRLTRLERLSGIGDDRSPPINFIIEDNGRDPDPGGPNVVGVRRDEIPENEEEAAEFFAARRPTPYGTVFFLKNDED